MHILGKIGQTRPAPLLKTEFVAIQTFKSEAGFESLARHYPAFQSLEKTGDVIMKSYLSITKYPHALKPYTIMNI